MIDKDVRPKGPVLILWLQAEVVFEMKAVVVARDQIREGGEISCFYALYLCA